MKQFFEAPPHRAFLAMVAASGIPSEDDNHPEGPDMSSLAPQAYAKRQSMHTLTESFRPLTGASILKERDTSSAVHSSWLRNAGFAGFGDNEAHGKIHSSLAIAAKTLTSSARRHDSGGQEATHTEKCPELHLLRSLSLINIAIQLPVVEGVLRLFSRLLMPPGRVARALLANALLHDYQR